MHTLRDTHHTQTVSDYLNMKRLFIVALMGTLLTGFSQPADTIIVINGNSAFQSFELEYVQSDSAEFYNSAYKNKIYFDSSHVRFGDSSFTLRTRSSRFSYPLFKGEYINGTNWYEYVGYLKPLNLYILHGYTYASNFILGEILLVDSLNSTHYGIWSAYDAPNELPLISPNEELMITYGNAPYDVEGEHRLWIINIHDNGEHHTYKCNYDFFESRKFAVEQIKWKDNDTIVIKGYSEVLVNGQWTKKYSFWKSKIPEEIKNNR